MILALAILAFSFVLEIISDKLSILPILNQKLIAGSNYSILQGVCAFGLDGINSLFNTGIALPSALSVGVFYNSAIALNSVTVLVIAIAFAIFVLMDIAVIVQSIVRLCTGRAYKTGFLYALFMAAAFIAVIVAVLLTALKAEMEIGTALLTAGLITFTVATIIIFILSAIAGAERKQRN